MLLGASAAVAAALLPAGAQAMGGDHVEDVRLDPCRFSPSLQHESHRVGIERPHLANCLGPMRGAAVGKIIAIN